MAYLKPVQCVCPNCKKSFTRMQGDVLTPLDLNPYCSKCSIKVAKNTLRKFLVSPKKPWRL